MRLLPVAWLPVESFSAEGRVDQVQKANPGSKTDGKW
jgi:hypothetical protein